MGKLYNITHANKIAEERDKYKTYTGGFGLAFLGTLVASGLATHRKSKQLKELREKYDALCASNTTLTEKLNELDTAVKTITTATPAPTIAPSPIVEEIKTVVEDTVDAVNNFTETAVETIKDAAEAEVVDFEEVAAEEIPSEIQKKIEDASSIVDVNVDTSVLEQAEKKAAEKKTNNNSNNKKKGGK